MSDFIQQTSCECSFTTHDSWVILTPIEQSIKRKIEEVGIPLKDWNVSINYGIKTGYNDAFIISETKRNEILSNCKSDDESQRTAELIRPILRGRDIKRYGYHFAGLYLINTHNGIKEKNISRIDIDDYPAVKKHLNEYWDKISMRADKGDTPYNLRNCAYMDELFQSKIIWGEISDNSKFAFDFNGTFMPEATTFYMRGENIEFLLAALNSKLSEWFFSKIGTTTGVGTVRWKKYTIEQLIVIKPTDKVLNDYLLLFENFKNKKISVSEFEQANDNLMFSLYDLSEEEIDYINKYQVKLI